MSLCLPDMILNSELLTFGVDSFRTPGLTSGLEGFVNVHRSDLLLVPK